MDMKVQVWHFLVRASASRMPDTEAVGGKAAMDGTGDAGDHLYDGDGDVVVRGAEVSDVTSGDDEDVPWMKLT
jgi:hypothetical protein